MFCGHERVTIHLLKTCINVCDVRDDKINKYIIKQLKRLILIKNMSSHIVMDPLHFLKETTQCSIPFIFHPECTINNLNVIYIF